MNIVIPGIHGLSSDPCIQLLAKKTSSGNNIVVPELGNSEYGSYGNIEGHLQGVARMIATIDSQPNLVTGHSLGGLAAIIYASKISVNGLILVNPQMGGKHDLRVSRNNYRASTYNWRRNGYQIRRDQNGNEYKLPWKDYWERSFRYDGIRLAGLIQSRVIIIAGKKDPYLDINKLYSFLNALRGGGHQLLETDCPHVPKNEGELNSLELAVERAVSLLT